MHFICSSWLKASSTCIRSGGVYIAQIDQGIKNALRLASTAKVVDPHDVEADVSPQGIQGDDCVNFKLWQENCRRYGLPNCDQQLQGIQSGRKTLSQVLAEQEKLIADIAREYRATMQSDGRQGVQDDYTDMPDISAPCPQGIQGDDCARFKLWLENCHKFGVKDCIQQYSSFKAGRKTLAQILDEQDKMIREAAQVILQQRRKYSTSTRDKGNKTSTAEHNSSSEAEGQRSEEAHGTSEVQLSQRQKLQRAIKEYGSTVIVFHVTISLASLGFFYLLVSSGLDVAGFLLRLNIGGEILKSKLAAGTSTFIVAYAVHKVFAPVRIATTLTATPFIVRHLRRVGFLKLVRTGDHIPRKYFSKGKVYSMKMHG
ncbi:protein fam210b [Plakobranchus ocellatus]|uniref:Protein fam210b n=1 Tax=Plakobranchus ocellatus TaxID=259542 RepID=A0AAV3ZK88_9GAST|nr:protein fam210b [Plakobranchus ocellatus]